MVAEAGPGPPDPRTPALAADLTWIMDQSLNAMKAKHAALENPSKHQRDTDVMHAWQGKKEAPLPSVF